MTWNRQSSLRMAARPRLCNRPSLRPGACLATPSEAASQLSVNSHADARGALHSQPYDARLATTLLDVYLGITTGAATHSVVMKVGGDLAFAQNVCMSNAAAALLAPSAVSTASILEATTSHGRFDPS